MTVDQVENACTFACEGIRLIPQDRNKKPLLSWDRASCDERQIREWSRMYPKANFAAVLDLQSMVFVIDIDVVHHTTGTSKPGLESIRRLEERHGRFSTRCIQTPSGGWHYWFAADGLPNVPNLQELPGYPGIEVKGWRSVCTLPGSFYADGREYRTENDLPIAPAPEWLKTLLAESPKSCTAEATGESVQVGNGPAPIPAGERNTTLCAIAGRFFNEGLSGDALLAALFEVNRMRCQPPLPANEIRQMVNQAGENWKHRAVDTGNEKVKKKTDSQGQSVEFPHIEPWPEPVDGDSLLTELLHVISSHVVLPDGGAVAMALWMLFTYTHDAFSVSPILCLSSPQMRCGKTTALALLRLVVARPLPTANITASPLFRGTEKWRPTLLIDEGDAFLKGNEEMRGILNSGHLRSGAFIIRTVGDEYEPRRFSTWAPKAIALIGRLPGTLSDRSITVRMRRKLPDEYVKRLRVDRDDLFKDLRRKALRWAQDHMEALRQSDPDLPLTNDRAADNWRPLIAVADEAGGDWPRIARETARMLSIDQDENVKERLLRDIRFLFEHQGTEKLFTVDITERLAGIEESPWGEYNRGRPITPRQLSQQLSEFGIKSKTIWIEEKSRKGYEKDDFAEAWKRYCDLQDSRQNGSEADISNKANELASDGSLTSDSSFRQQLREVSNIDESIRHPSGVSQETVGSNCFSCNNLSEISDASDGLTDEYTPKNDVGNDDRGWL